jgi:tetratricopeptide (TPR) repeat protein
MSPAPSTARPFPKAEPRGLPGGADFDDAEIDAALMPLSFAPPPASEAPAPRAASVLPTPAEPPPEPAPPASFDAPADSWSLPIPSSPPPGVDERRASPAPPAVDDDDAGPATRQSVGVAADAERAGGLPEAAASGPAPRAPSDAAVTTFDDWQDEPVTSVRAGEEPGEATMEYVSASLEDLGVAEEDDEAPLAPAAAARDGDSGGQTSRAEDGGAPRPAAAHLGDQRLIDAWVARAEWFEAESQATEDVHARARLLLAASELWAMSGNTSRARDAAKASSQAAPSLGIASRQARALAAVEGDWKAAALALDAEARSAPTDESRAHAAYVAAEVHRLSLSDAQGAERRLDLVTRTSPADPRPYLIRLAAELAAGAAGGTLRWPEVPDLAPLQAAAAELLALRTGVASAGPRSPTLAFEDARRALGAGDLAAAGAALRELGHVTDFGGGALFLAAALLAPSAETRRGAIDSLLDLLGRERSAPVRRALAARALEQGDAAAMAQALASIGGEAAVFGPADRVALGALAGGAGASLATEADALLEDETLRPLAAAATAASAPGAGAPVGDPETRTRLTLGRRLSVAKTPDELKDAVHGLRAASPQAALGRILSLELDAAAGATSAVAAELARLSAADRQADGKLAAALIEELSGHADAARRYYSAALATPAMAEPAARALFGADGAGSGDLLATLASALGDEATARQSLLLLESAIRSGLEDAEATDDVLGRAHDAYPDLPFAARLGGDLARARGDVPKVVAWLRRQGEAAQSPMGQALDAVREALLIAEEDGARAGERLNDALGARPADVALLELAERMNPVATLERARWRERIAEQTELPRTKAWLLFEASAEYERQGALGDAARTARAAAVSGGSELARVMAERLAPEEAPAPLTGLAALRATEQSTLGTDRDEELEGLASKLVDLPDPGESTAHARLGARLRLKRDSWESTRDLVERAGRHSPRSLWALRQLSTHARVAGDDATLLEIEKGLADRVTRPLDSATLTLRAAEAAARLGRFDEAMTLLSATIETAPDHLVARDLRARIAEQRGDAARAAEDLEVIGSSSAVAEHQWDAWYRAGVLWLGAASDADRGLGALEKAGAIDITKKDVFDRLQLLYVQRGDRGKLASLLEARLAKTTDPEERIALEVTRSRALADVGDRDAARRALEAALEANPDHADALEVYAGLSATDGEWQNAEQAWIRLARVVTVPEKQAEIYGRLAALYDDKLPNPARAEICYREILKRRPDDTHAMQLLVRVYVRLGDAAKAVELQNELLERATTNEEKRDQTIGLASVYAEAAKDKKAAFAVLEKARKAWPHDSAVLRAMAQHHERYGEAAALNVLLDRAAAEARRALSHGRFDLAFFGVLETAAEMRGNADAAAVAGATLAALEGRADVSVQGGGAAASAADLDDLLAPELLSPALRAILRKLPGVFDTAYPVDLKALRASPFPPSAAEIAGEIRAVAESMGVRSLELLVSTALGPVFLPVSSAPARLVVGHALLESQDDGARYFSLVRALKMMQAEAAAFTRIAPIELWPAVAALLGMLAKGWQAQGVDAGKLAEATRRIEAARTKALDDDLATLALEVGGSIGNRASQLGQAIGQWASRTALLAVGSPSLGLRGVALSLGQGEGPPEDPSERLKWVLRHPEARDLAVFSVSDGYAEARRRIGLGS